MLRIIFIFFAFTAIGMRTAQADENPSQAAFEKRLQEFEKKSTASYSYNPPGRAEVRKGYNLFLTADLLYLSPKENGLEYAVQVDLDHRGITEGSIHDLHYDWELGVRVGLGYNVPHDQWDIYLNWFRVYPNAHAETTSPDLFPVWGTTFLTPFQNKLEKADAHWNLRLDQIDLELGRESLVSRWLSIRPHLGLRTLWIRQHYSMEYHFEKPIFLNFAKEKVSLRNRYWGLGMCGGIDTQWALKDGWSVYGNAAFSLLYGEFHLHERDFQSDFHSPFAFGPTHFKADFENHLHLVSGIFDLAAGIAWDRMFDDDQLHLGLRLGWEQHLYFAQNQLFRMQKFENFSNVIANQGDLTLQGFVLSGRVDF